MRSPGDIDADELEMRLAQMPMIGRKEHLKKLLRWGQQAMETGGVLRVTGELGVGKSRLVEEWMRHMELHSATILTGRYREDNSPGAGLREALSPLLQVDGRSGLHLPEGVLAPEVIESLRTILDPNAAEDGVIRDPQQDARDGALATIEHALYDLARQRPTILLLENLQWADAFTTRLVERWREELATRAIGLVLVCTERTDEATSNVSMQHTSHIRPRTPHTFTYSYELYVERLSDHDAGEVLDELLPFAVSLRERIVQTARGNPLYLTQIVRYLVEEDLIARDEKTGEWGLLQEDEAQAEPSLLPPDLEALLMQRVRTHIAQHRLSGVLDQILMRAMLLGNRFEVRLLRELLRHEGRPDLESYLDEALEVLGQSGVLVPTVMHGRAGLEFGYETLRTPLIESSEWSDQERHELHAAIAEVEQRYWEQRDPTLVDLHAHEIAAHWRACGDSERAFEWLMRAARAAEQGQDFRRALEYLTQASERLTPRPRPRRRTPLGDSPG